jgi:hypothetical protein
LTGAKLNMDFNGNNTAINSFNSYQPEAAFERTLPGQEARTRGGVNTPW